MKKRRISQQVVCWLLLAVAAAFLLSVALTYALLSRRSDKNTETLLSQDVRDVSQDIQYMANHSILEYARSFVDWVGSAEKADAAYLTRLAEANRLTELNCVDETGIIVSSNVPDRIGYDMGSGEQSAEFLCLLEGETEYVQDFGPASQTPWISRKFAAVAFPDGGFLQIGLDEEQFHDFVADQAQIEVINRHIGETGSLLICDGDLTVVSSLDNRYQGRPLEETGVQFDPEGYTPYARFLGSFEGEDTWLMANEVQSFYVLGIYPVSEANAARTMSIITGVIMETVVFAVLFLLLLYLLRRLVVDRITEVTGALNTIAAGHLDRKVDVRTAVEFDQLSNDINATVDTLKRYIAEAAARIDRDLELARAIQTSALPRIFPPFPGRTEFELFASMDPAKEVGGDFYDFFLIGERKLGFLIADVSGKGIPAAMFMMTAKTMLKGYAESGREVQDVFTLTNRQLCEHNDADMFVTAWMGILDLDSGEVAFANAGHNPPLVRHRDDGFSCLQPKVDLILAEYSRIRYRTQSLVLTPGDEIFLYTDGITEAANGEGAMYGEDRLLRYLQTHTFESAEALCRGVREDVERFADGAAQFDDITMLSLRYLGAGEKNGGY